MRLYDPKYFLNTFKRYISCKRIFSHVYSDYDTNFIGTDAELKDLFSTYYNKSSQTVDQVSESEIQWHFNPPGAPHFGGLREAVVKSAKHHLKSLNGDSTSTF